MKRVGGIWMGQGDGGVLWAVGGLAQLAFCVLDTGSGSLGRQDLAAAIDGRRGWIGV